MALTLYHVDWCPECLAVKGKLDALQVAYDSVIVPDIRMFRKQVHAVSGQYYVPVIKDGDLVLTETADILAYLDEAYGKGAGPEAKCKWQHKTPKPDQTHTLPGEDDEYSSCRL